jgi:hypothetical protein
MEGKQFNPEDRVDERGFTLPPGVSPLPSIQCAEAARLAELDVGTIPAEDVFLLGFHLVDEVKVHEPGCPAGTEDTRDALLEKVKTKLAEVYSSSDS